MENMHIDVRVCRVNWETHNLVGPLCCVLGQNTSSLHQGILMSINILSRKPDEMLGEPCDELASHPGGGGGSIITGTPTLLILNLGFFLMVKKL